MGSRGLACTKPCLTCAQLQRRLQVFRICRDEDLDPGGDDWLTRQRFGSYDEAYDVLARYYADLCCSDDRIYYRIEHEPHSS